MMEVVNSKTPASQVKSILLKVGVERLYDEIRYAQIRAEKQRLVAATIR